MADKTVEAEDIAAQLAELAQKMDRLKVLYEQYFMGIERIEPQVARKEVSRAMLLLQQRYIRNTGLRFKFNTLLQKWNKVHNLTAVRDPNDMVTLHLLDSLAVLPHIRQGRLLDVGSGAGLPGIPLAIVRPDLQVTVMDSNHKKASFMRQAKAMLGIGNLEVTCGRVEEFQPEHKFDMVISRAFLPFSTSTIVSTGCPLAMPGKTYLLPERSHAPADAMNCRLSVWALVAVSVILRSTSPVFVSAT